jgi:hypothetical protein
MHELEKDMLGSERDLDARDGRRGVVGEEEVYTMVSEYEKMVNELRTGQV